MTALLNLNLHFTRLQQPAFLALLVSFSSLSQDADLLLDGRSKEACRKMSHTVVYFLFLPLQSATCWNLLPASENCYCAQGTGNVRSSSTCCEYQPSSRNYLVCNSIDGASSISQEDLAAMCNDFATCLSYLTSLSEGFPAH